MSDHVCCVLSFLRNSHILTHPHPYTLTRRVTRYDFIVAKYKNLQLLPRLSQKDNPNAYQDLSKVSKNSL